MPDTALRLLTAAVDVGPHHRRDALRTRLATAVGTLTGDPGLRAEGRSTADLVQRLVAAVDPGRAEQVWLLLAVLRAELPTRADVDAVRRRAVLDGLATALRTHLPSVQSGWPLRRGEWPQVRVVGAGEVLVDLHHTSTTSLATGIQRVARQVSRRWADQHDVTLVAWTARERALRELSPPERHRALHGGGAVPRPDHDVVLVPWHSTYLLPELMVERTRAACLEALLEFSGVRSGIIGFDTVPISSAETVGEGMASGFAAMLGAAARADRIATISEAAAVEYGGWRTMLGGAGLAGPQIVPVSLPTETPEPSEADVAYARSELCTADLPLVLVVGSHEPRKNHPAVLHAAELLWRRGVRFSLVFIGGNAWRSEAFRDRLEALRAAGRPVESRSAITDALLFGGYRAARVTLFPSLNEGFGLPVAESLTLGTPVVTTGYGSLGEIVAAGGALVADPRDDHDIADTLGRLLTDDALHAELTAAALARPRTTWDDYAATTWDLFTAPVEVTA